MLDSNTGREAERAAGCIRYVATGPSGRQVVLDGGALPSLVRLLRSSKGKEAEHAAGAVRNIARGSSELGQALLVAEAMPALTHSALAGSADCKLASCLAIISLMNGSAAAVEAAVRTGALGALL